jgi:hypothetical protein
MIFASGSTVINSGVLCVKRQRVSYYVLCSRSCGCVPDLHGSASFWKAKSGSYLSEAVSLSKSQGLSGSGSGSASKIKFRSYEGSKWSHVGQWVLTLYAWRQKRGPWWVCMPVIAVSHHLDENLDLDLDPNQSEK